VNSIIMPLASTYTTMLSIAGHGADGFKGRPA